VFHSHAGILPLRKSVPFGTVTSSPQREFMGSGETVSPVQKKPAAPPPSHSQHDYPTPIRAGRTARPSARQLNTRCWARISGSTTWHAHVPSGRPARSGNLASSPRRVSFLQRATPQRPRESKGSRRLAPSPSLSGLQCFRRQFHPVISRMGLERVRLRNQSNSAICLPPPPALSWLSGVASEQSTKEEHGVVIKSP
jgi:hypothetical protein